MSTYPLELDRGTMDTMGRAAVDLLANFIESLPDAPADGTTGAEEIVPHLLAPPPDASGELEPLLEQFRQAAAYAIETAGPCYLGYIPGSGLFSSAIAEMLARGFNRFTAISTFAPALVALEDSTMRWLCGEFGLPATASGQITTGGSLATLTSVVAARHDRLGEDFLDGTLYVTPHTHRSVAKAARVAGIPPSRVRLVPTDKDLRMDVAAAAELIAADRAAGHRPFLLGATAGTTDTGVIDPLPELAELAEQEGLWLHVDGAYGGFFHLTERGRALLAGIDRADALVLDPHKGLFLPHGTGVLLVRDRATLHAAFAADGHYLQDLHSETSLPNYADLGPELTRDYRGLRLWLPLHLHGVDAFRRALDEKLDLAAHVYGQLSAEPRLAVPWEPDLSVVAFRLRGDDPDDIRNRQFLEKILAPNRVLLSSTQIRDEFLIRMCLLSHRTHRDRVDEALAIIRDALD